MVMGLQDDFAREGRPERVKGLNQLVEAALNAWSQRWALDGIHIRCRVCNGRQKLSDSGKPFLEQHESTCPFSGAPEQLPFGQLAGILDGWRMELWEEDN
jgi:hypothetical protein